MGLHTYSSGSLFQAAVTFLTWSIDASLSLMVLNLTQRVNFLATWIKFASDLCNIKDFSHLRVLLHTDELSILGLLAITAITASFLPFCDAGLAVDSCLAKIA